MKIGVIFILSGFLLAGCSPREKSTLHYTDWNTPQAKALREAIAKNPSDPANFYWRGYCASHVKDLETVNSSYSEAIRLDPSNQWYRISYGWALFNAESYPDALKQWLSAYEFCEGKHPENNITVALGYYGVKNYDLASNYYAKQVQLNKRYGSFDSLQEVTESWTWQEKDAVYRLYDIWRYSHGRASD